MGVEYRIYTDGACHAESRRGGWAALVADASSKRSLSGHEERTTSNRMEILAAIRGLEATRPGTTVVVYSDSQYLVNTMTRNWRRQKNLDLWRRLDELASQRQVVWEWVQGHVGRLENEEANLLASREAGTLPIGAAILPHLDEKGRARMVDVGWKGDTEREAVARGFVSMKPETLRLINAGQIEKGDVLSAARIAGIMAAKRTPELIPLCHPLPLAQVEVELEPDEAAQGIRITAMVKTVAKTGVEMEALTAVAVAGLTVYDMCKAVDRGMRIEQVRLVRKRGGKSGEVVLEE